jgi:hypothetical protein
MNGNRSDSIDSFLPNRIPIVLVCMPFAQYKQPSIGLSLLKAELAQR